MAANTSFSSTALPLNTSSTKLTSLSSSKSVFFSYNINSRAGLSLDRPRKAHKRGFSCNCLFGLGVPELVVIAGVTALVFGPKKLPEVGRSVGKTIKSFQQAAKEFESELKKDSELPADDTITPVSEEKKQEGTVPTTKETS
ncbi:hypothetical protein RD792_015845 [Penstemon davidsonii]|uniref:Sec-independent protein translocase protein TATA, chloroplastic n=1 Tax=Penstemon davidsonii TaxID=160366 RepID=A0ABR0CHY2_9LAMI|nr:hypothetical protein RD792_015845 [Penstemon davidsonii]